MLRQAVYSAIALREDTMRPIVPTREEADLDYELIELGWTEWFQQRAACEASDTLARVIAVDRDRLLMAGHGGHFRGKLAGSPGMREFGVLGAQDGFGSSYSGIVLLASRCRFRDCTHTGESGCAVRAAVQTGEISAESLENFLKLREESEATRRRHAAEAAAA